MTPPPFDRAEEPPAGGETASGENRIGRWTLFRDVAVLQGKLVLDNIKDLVLVPV